MTHPSEGSARAAPHAVAAADPTARDNAAPEAPTLTALLRAFGWIGLTSIGQGRVSYFYDELVRKRRWLNEREFLEGSSISSVLPGPNVSNMSVYFGQHLGGVFGALIASAAIITPGALMILALGILYFHGLPASITAPVGRGIGAAAVGLVAATVWRTGAPVLRTRPGGVIAALTFLLFGVAGLNIFVVLLLMIPLSLLLFRSPRS